MCTKTERGMRESAKKGGRERDITIWVKHPRDKSNSWWLVRVIFCKLQSKLERAYRCYIQSIVSKLRNDNIIAHSHLKIQNAKAKVNLIDLIDT